LQSLIQAHIELSLLLDDDNRISDARLISLSHVECDVPVTGMWRRENNGESTVKTAAISKTPKALEIAKLAIGGQHDVALCVAVNLYGVSVVKILSGMDELHNVMVLVCLSDARLNHGNRSLNSACKNNIPISSSR
jgi:hypothetical protein